METATPYLMSKEESEDFRKMFETHAARIGYAKEVLADKNASLFKILTPTVTMYKSGQSFVAVRTHAKRPAEIAYWMQYRVEHVFNKQIASHIAVWFEPSYDLPSLPKEMVFNYLLKQYDAVMTDNSQTWDGKRFWMNRLADVFAKTAPLPLLAYFWHRKTGDLVQLDEDYNYTLLMEKEAWTGPDAKDKMIILSKKPIKG